MLKVTNIEEYAVTTYYSGTLEDDEGNDYRFTLKEIEDNDIGSSTHEIIWLDEIPDGLIDDDLLVDLCYKVMLEDNN